MCVCDRSEFSEPPFGASSKSIKWKSPSLSWRVPKTCPFPPHAAATAKWDEKLAQRWEERSMGKRPGGLRKLPFHCVWWLQLQIARQPGECFQSPSCTPNMQQ